MCRSISAVQVWVHAASAGDVAALEPLLRHAGDQPPLLSVVTATGRAMAERLYPRARVTRWPFVFGRRFANPPSLLLIEGLELWPALLRSARRAGTRVAIVNARISERSLCGYRSAWPLFRSAIDTIDLVCARSADDATRFATLGVPCNRIHVTGWTKYDRLPGGDQAARHRDHSATCDSTPRAGLILGSTHAGEEQQLAPHLSKLALPVTIAPRYPKRAKRVRRNVPSARVIDSMGTLASLYGEAKVAFVGGSLVPRGGHNVLEAAAGGCGVITGPSIETVQLEMRELIDAGVAKCIRSARGLPEAIRDLAQEEDLPTRARAVVERFRGATARTLYLLRSLN